MSTKRERIEPNPGDIRYVRRDDEGQFTDDQVDVGASSAADQRHHSETPAKPGQGDKDDRQKEPRTSSLPGPPPGHLNGTTPPR